MAKINENNEAYNNIEKNFLRAQKSNDILIKSGILNAIELVRNSLNAVQPMEKFLTETFLNDYLKTIQGSLKIRHTTEESLIKYILPQVKEMKKTFQMVQTTNNIFGSDLLSGMVSQTIKSMEMMQLSEKVLVAELLSNQMKIMIESLEQDDSYLHELFLENDIDIESSSDREQIINLIEDENNKLENSKGDKLVLERFFENLMNTYIIFKDTNPIVASVLSSIYSLAWVILMSKLSGVFTINLYVIINGKKEIKKTTYNITKNYYIQGASEPYKTELKIYDKTTEELLDEGYISKRKLTEIKKLEAIYNNNEGRGVECNGKIRR